MSEVELGAPMFRSMVVGAPQVEKVNGMPTKVTVNVRRRGKKHLIEVKADCNNRYFGELLGLRTGDEMFASYDGEDFTYVKRNPWWKRIWLRCTW